MPDLTEGFFCHSCANDLMNVECNDEGTVVCPRCSAETKASDPMRLLNRARAKFLNRAECCKDAANLSPRGDRIVKCSVCGARNITFPDQAG